MARSWELIGHYTGEAQTYEDLAGAFQASPYLPPKDGRLIGVRTITAPEAATSLVENFQIRLTCAIWTPNEMHVGGCGNGLATVPAFPAPTPIDFECDQPVQASVPINSQGRHAVATAVTCNVMVFGLFEW